MNYTTVEQSKKLLEFGLNPETADMWWTPLNWQLTEYYVEVKQDGIGTPKNPIPCWSLGALLELMPKIDNQLPSLRKCENYYCVVYSDIVTRLGDNQWQNGKTPLEAACNMIIWLLENDYIKTE